MRKVLPFLLAIASGVGAFIVTTKLRFAERATDYFKRRVYWGWERHSIVGPRHFSYRILFGEVFEEPTSINSLIKGDPAVLKRVRDLLGDKEVIDADWYIIDDALSFGSASQSIHYRASKLAKQQWLIEKLSAELGPLGLVSEERRIELIREVTAEWEASIVSDLDAIQRGNTTAASMLANLPA